MYSVSSAFLILRKFQGIDRVDLDALFTKRHPQTVDIVTGKPTKAAQHGIFFLWIIWVPAKLGGQALNIQLSTAGICIGKNLNNALKAGILDQSRGCEAGRFHGQVAKRQDMQEIAIDGALLIVFAIHVVLPQMRDKSRIISPRRVPGVENSGIQGSSKRGNTLCLLVWETSTGPYSLRR